MLAALQERDGFGLEGCTRKLIHNVSPISIVAGGSPRRWRAHMAS
jgi:hypothetical protein